MIEALGEAATGKWGWTRKSERRTVSALRRRRLIDDAAGGGEPVITARGRAWYDGYRQGRADGRAGR